jgi:hypothetical protein
VAGSNKHSSEPPGFIKGRGFINFLTYKYYQILKKNCSMELLVTTNFELTCNVFTCIPEVNRLKAIHFFITVFVVYPNS